MPIENIWDWSTVAIENTNSDSGINWAEGQARATVNNSARSMMAAIAKYLNLTNGSIVTTGTANAQAFLSGYSPLFTTVPAGFTCRLKLGPGLTNTDVATLSMDGITATIIKNTAGSDVVEGALVGGAITDFVFDGTNWITLNAVIPEEEEGPWSTGDVKLTFKTVAEEGWIICDDGSIGNATSSATTRANADTVDLFTLFYDNITTLELQDNIGLTITRGASAAADYAANRRLVVPKTLGHALAGAGSGSGLTARTLGVAVGAETETQTIAKMAPHTHKYHDCTVAGGAQFLQGGPASTGPLVDATSEGGGEPLNIMQPTQFLNVMVKL